MSYDCYCDYDPAEFYVARFPIARKGHRCDECGGPIAIGERYEYVSAKWDEFSYFRTCGRCHDIRRWVQNNIPCFCWSHGGLDDDAREAVSDACDRAPEETVGLKFGLARRLIMRNRFNRQRLGT